MKIRPRSRSEQGVELIECLVYCAAFMVVTGVAIGAFFQGLTYTVQMHRNTADIARVVQIGERWRNDVRNASGPLTHEKGVAGVALHIPTAAGEIAYLFVTNSVIRCTAKDNRCETLLPTVASSEFVKDSRRYVESWRWELELASRMKAARVKPVFTFTSVPTQTPKP